MKSRCNNPNVPAYKNYGGRGIAVCEAWQRFEAFYADMGDPPVGMSLERIDNDGPYSPDNCVWATLHQQAHNKRNNVMVTMRGKRMCVAEWARELGVSRSSAYLRINAGADAAMVLVAMARHRRNRADGSGGQGTE